MDDLTTSLIFSQSITFLLLVISETLPFTTGVANGMLHALLIMLKFIKVVAKPAEEINLY